jgi:hypothetical protein
VVAIQRRVRRLSLKSQRHSRRLSHPLDPLPPAYGDMSTGQLDIASAAMAGVEGRQ